jgi:hypothetical protein
VVGPQIFRFEYYYLLKNGQLSSSPWMPGASSVRGLQDVSAIIVDIAGIDPKSRALLDNSAQAPPPTDNITLLGAQLIDWGNTACPSCSTLPCPTQQDWQTTPGLLRAQWQCTLNQIIADSKMGQVFVPRPAIQGVRLHERCFYLNQ